MVMPSRRLALRLGAAVLVGVALAGGVGVWLERTPPSPAQAQVEAAPLPLADEAAILASPASDPSVFRYANNPEIVVLRFPTLAAQAQMLNRVAALIEKPGLPRDRVLDDAALAVATGGVGQMAAEFLLAHDYRADDLLRFFTLADRDGVALNPAEVALRALLARLDWHRAGAAGALISVAGTPEEVQPALLAAALRHELSHGEFFTRPTYAAHVRRFWAEALTEGERAAVRARLAASGYNAKDEELMANEMQAYLAHTPGQGAAQLGLPPARIEALRLTFIEGMPSGWLRDSAQAR
jgi:hypothetical protein